MELGDQIVLHHAEPRTAKPLGFSAPQLYFKGCLATWQAPELFQALPHHTTDTLQQHPSNAFPGDLHRSGASVPSLSCHTVLRT